MKLSQPSLKALRKVITGDDRSDGEPIAPYRTGSQLGEFFNRFGAGDPHGPNSLSRRDYTKEHLLEKNGDPVMKEICEAAVDPRHFWESDLDCKKAVEYLNNHLEFDGYRLDQVGKRYQLIDAEGSAIEVGDLITEEAGINPTFIQDQLEKCDRKLSHGDLTGAITNARSLVEAVLREIEDALDPNPPRYDGNLSKLYNRVYRHMNLDPSQEGLSNAAREILSGLISTISGLAPIRNAASDAHAIEYAPKRHHAELAVNAAKTVVRFLRDSLEYQLENDLVDFEAIERSV